MKLPETSTAKDLGLLAVSVVALAGCLLVSVTRAHSSGPVATQARTEVCLVTSRTGQYLSGSTVLRTSGEAPVDITAVRLGAPDGLDLQDSYVVPIRGGEVIGDLGRWPPSRRTIAETGADWDDRVDAVGADRLDPASGTHRFNLVLHLAVAEGAARSADGRFASVQVDYVADDRAFSTTDDLAFRVEGSC